MDKSTLLVLALVLMFLVGYNVFFLAPAEEARQQHVAEETAATPAAATPAAPAEEAFTPGKGIVVTTPNYVATFNERGGRLSSFRLTKYAKRKLKNDEPDEDMQLVAQPSPDDWPMRLTLSDEAAPKLAKALFTADQSEINVAPGQTARLTMAYTDAGGLSATRVYTFSGDGYAIGQAVTLENRGEATYGGYATMRLNSAPFDPKNKRYAEMAGFVNGKMVEAQPNKAADELMGYRGKLSSVEWLGYMDQYFLTALLAEAPQEEEPGAAPPSLSAALQDHGGVAVGLSYPVSLMPGQRLTLDFPFYYGPKSADDLAAAGHHLSRSVDLGWFSFLARPLAALLRVIYGWVGNYGWAIIIVTVLIKIVLWPLTAKSYKSMKKMQQLQPKVAKLRERYADDKEAMNKEIMALYKTFKVSPMGGCLPMAMQIPFFIAFYRVLDSFLELRGAPFMLWMTDLAAPDRLGSLDFTIPFFEPPTGLPVLTLIMGASMVIQQKMTPNTMGDPAQAKMMMFMPVIFTFILINMPAGLVLYWLVNNILSIAQQAMINRPAKAKA